ISRLHYFKNNVSWDLEGFLNWSMFYATDFGNKDMEHRAYRTYLEAILNDPKLLEPRDGETARELAEEALKEFKKEANSVKIDIFWRNCPSFLETLNTAVNLNTNKMIGRVSELHEDVSNTIFSITQDKLHFERKRVRSHEEESVESQKKKASSRKRGNTLPDGTKIKKSAPLDLFPDEEDSSEEHDGEDNEQDDDEDVPAPEEILDSILGSQKKWILPSGKNVGDITARNISTNAKVIQKKKKTSAIERAILRYGSSRIIDLSTNMKDWFSVDDRKFMMKNHNAILQVPGMAVEESSFVTTVENMICEQKANEAYKFCIETHIDSKENSYMYKLSKIYSDLCKDRVDMLDYGHTEIDVILKTCSYIIEGLNKDLVIRQKCIEYHKGRKCDVRFLSTSGVDIGEWEFASNLTAQKAIGDRCRSGRINQSILNGLLNRNLNDEQAKKINVPFLQVASTSGQMLVEDLVEGFYVVFPGPTFEFPTKLRHIENLKSAVNIIKFVMDKYIQTNEIVESKVSIHNAFDDIFSNNNDLVMNKLVHCKSKYICELWWTPKK
ncbi:10472_t:CDS:2, partial [Entrophospora sp. SA101]